MRKLIGLGEFWNDLYYFKESIIKSVSMNKVAASLDFWHMLLGHYSYKNLKLASFLANKYFESLNNYCDVCYCAKQTRKPFSFNSNKSLILFFLIHIDI